MAASLRNLRKPMVVVALEGWNDASDAATQAVDRLVDVSNAETVQVIDDEEYYDFTEQRPVIHGGPDGRFIEWPGIEILVGHLGRRDVVIVTGPEPNLRWRSLARVLVSALRSAQPELVILMGAMLTDAPHSRPTPVGMTSSNRRLRDRFGLEQSDYEGPTGMLGVLADACERAGMVTLSMWASIPHYVANPPNPKATASLLLSLEDVLDEAIGLGDLPEQARQWEESVNELVSDDPDISDYVAKLEEQSDQETPKVVSGDVIAAEFQRYLRRQHREQ